MMPPMSGSFTASQIFRNTMMPAKVSELMPMNWVKKRVKYDPARVNAMLHPKSPAAYET